MTSFSEQQLPTSVRAQFRGGPRYATEIVATRGGVESRNSLMARARRQWDIEYVQDKADIDTLYQFFLTMQGAGVGFRFKDWYDYTSTMCNGTGRLGATGAGTGEPTYQLYKRYTSGALTQDEKIWKPIASGFSAERAGYPLVAGAGAGQYGLDATTGAFTMVADATASITGHTVGSSHVVVTTVDMPSLGIGDKVYITGVTGTAAALLNGIAHTISNKVVGSPDIVWTLSTNTGGSPTLTATGGTAAAYPQADETMTWAGEFDRPVRFGGDEFNWEFVAGQTLLQVSGLSIIELLL